MAEIPDDWRIVPGTEQGYAATPEGDIVRLPRTVAVERLGKPVVRKYGIKTLTQSTGSSGHKVVGISVDGLITVQSVHRLVCTAFHGPPPLITHNLVRHLNGNPADNRPENLRWGTPDENGRDMAWHNRQRHNSEPTTERGSELDDTELVCGCTCYEHFRWHGLCKSEFLERQRIEHFNRSLKLKEVA